MEDYTPRVNLERLDQMLVCSIGTLVEACLARISLGQ